MKKSYLLIAGLSIIVAYIVITNRPENHKVVIHNAPILKKIKTASIVHALKKEFLLNDVKVFNLQVAPVNTKHPDNEDHKIISSMLDKMKDHLKSIGMLKGSYTYNISYIQETDHEREYFTTMTVNNSSINIKIRVAKKDIDSASFFETAVKTINRKYCNIEKIYVSDISTIAPKTGSDHIIIFNNEQAYVDAKYEKHRKAMMGYNDTFYDDSDSSDTY